MSINVASLGTHNSVSIGASTTGHLRDAFQQQSARQWKGGAKQEIPSAPVAAEQAAKSSEATAAKAPALAQRVNPQSAEMRFFFEKDSSPKDYGTDYRVDGWFARAPRGKEQPWSRQPAKQFA